MIYSRVRRNSDGSANCLLKARFSFCCLARWDAFNCCSREHHPPNKPIGGCNCGAIVCRTDFRRWKDFGASAAEVSDRSTFALVVRRYRIREVLDRDLHLIGRLMSVGDDIVVLLEMMRCFLA